MKDNKKKLIDLYRIYTDSESHHMDLPNIIIDKLKTVEQVNVNDIFGCNARFDWIKDTNLIKGYTLVDLAGSAGFFSLQAITERMIESAAVFDINQDALTIGRLCSQLLGISEKIKYENRSVEINNLQNLPNADVVFCLNLMHHAGIIFDETIVGEIGWENYAIEYLKQLREKYHQIVISLAFKGTHKPKGLYIPFHKFEKYFQTNILKSAGWHCHEAANVGLLQESLRLPKNSMGYKLKNYGLDVIWLLTRHWSLTKKLTEVANLTKPGRLGRYFIFMAS